MSVALACASHTPLLFEEELASSEICQAVKRSFNDLAAFISNFDPQVVIEFAPDHYHGFHYDNMPSFCIGTTAYSVGDWKTSVGSFASDENFALEILDAVRDADIDAAVSFEMAVDHGFSQIWEEMFGRLDKYPVIPIFINAIAHPLPKYRRARLLGEAVGRFVKNSGKRVLFAASGGLSHDPIVPAMRGASPELRERLIGRVKQDPEHQARREAQVRVAAKLAMELKGPSLPLNAKWDKEFLNLLRYQDWEKIDQFTSESVAKVAGFGGNEVLCWVAATAAMSVCAPFEIVQEDYIEVPGWIAGLAHFAARER